jgi:hypothetical protein
MNMTKVGQLIQEEIEAAAAKAAAEAAAENSKQIAKNMLDGGMTLSDVVKYTGLPMSEAEMLV